MTPGVSILIRPCWSVCSLSVILGPESCLRLTLKVLHDVQKLVVHLGLVLKLDFDHLEVGERILDVEGA